MKLINDKLIKYREDGVVFVSYMKPIDNYIQDGWTVHHETNVHLVNPIVWCIRGFMQAHIRTTL
jgi:hypothetical protein